MKSKLLVIPVVISTVFLGACASNKSAYPTQNLIRDKASIAAEAQRDYAAAINQDAIAMSRKRSAIGNDEVDVDFIGKPEALLQDMAQRYGYTYAEEGKKYELRTINIRMERVLPIDVMRNVGNMVNDGADVVLNTVDKTIKLVYKPLN